MQIQDNKEQRVYGIECRMKDDDKDDKRMTIGGLASIFNSYTPMGWYMEVVKPGFFDDMDFEAAAALKNHDSNLVLGRYANKTLRLNITNQGLEYEVDLPDTTTGRDTYEEVKRGDIYQSSFQFTIKEQVWREVDRSEFAGVFPDEVLDRMSYGGKIEVRELIKGAKLYDVAPVTFPAYNDTTVAKRSKEALQKTKINLDLYNYRLRIAAASLPKL